MLKMVHHHRYRCLDFAAIFYVLLIGYSASAQQPTEKEDDSGASPQLLLEKLCVSGGSSSGLCYSIWKFDEPLTKDEAVMHCKSQNRTLATILTVSTQMTLGDQLGSEAEDSAWTGLSLISTQSWKFLHKSGWYESPPSSSYGNSFNNQYACLVLNRNRVFGTSCNRPLPYICEFTDQPSAEIESECVGGLKKVNRGWICAKSQNQTWVDAARRCDQEDGSLVFLDSNNTINQIQEFYASENFHFWTAGTRVHLIWDEIGVESNPYSLLWSNELAPNPNLDNVWREKENKYCVSLSRRSEGLVYKKCSFKLSQAICSQVNHEVLTSSTSTPATANVTSTSNSSSTGSAYTGVLAPINNCSDKSTNLTADAASPPGGKTAASPGAINPNNYKAAVICAYILGFLLLVGIILAIVLLVRRRRRKRSPKYYDPVLNLDRKSYRTLGNGTLGRQRSTEPSSEWDKIMVQNEEHAVQMRKKSPEPVELDIIHNVPLDPRATLERPLTIPRESHMVTLQRAKSRESQNSLISSDVATFTMDQRSNGNHSSVTSIARIGPPVPPKVRHLHSPITASADTNEQICDFPPPPADLLDDSSDALPTLPPKPTKRPPRRHKKKQPPIPDPVYAKIDKERKGSLPPPIAKKPTSYGATDGSQPAKVNIDTSTLPDNSDSGVEMGINSPAYNGANNNNAQPASQPGNTERQLAYLDNILDHMNSS